jgi:hypothetical protein
MYEVKLNADDVSRTFRVLRQLDPDLVKEFRKDLQSDLKPLAKAIAAKYPSSPPNLRGFDQAYNQWAWGTVVGKVSVTPGKSRKGVGRNNLVALRMTYKTATPYVVDMIGQVNPGVSPQGRRLYSALMSRFPGWPSGGRIFYKEFQAQRGEVFGKAEKILGKFVEKINRYI